MELRPYQSQAIKECWDALKKDNEPALLVACVASGKSLMLGNIALSMQKAGKRVLCLVSDSELVRNNCETFRSIGGDGSIYCAALKNKDCSSPVVFGSPLSVLGAISKGTALSQIAFNLIIVDEAHCINYENKKSSFMSIIDHYLALYPEMRILGATGTNFRFKDTAIVGEYCLFQTQVGNIIIENLVAQGYLVPIQFKVDKNLIIDFSKVQVNVLGRFDHQKLCEVLESSHRLTRDICHQIVHVMEEQKRFGVFIFATTTKHAQEIMSYLPLGEAAIILGDTPSKERTRILQAARAGLIKYLVNISIISVGVDVPPYDTVAYLRPTESLVLLVQTIGRGLRLSPRTGKTHALIMDFAGNIERHRDWESPLIIDAVEQTIDQEMPLVIECPVCFTWNTEHARRCKGMVAQDERQFRCEYYFTFRECPECAAQNDIAARKCRACEYELIDPNKKLSFDGIDDGIEQVEVLQSRYGLSGNWSMFQVHCAYECQSGTIYQRFMSWSKSYERAIKKFILEHRTHPEDWNDKIFNKDSMQNMLVGAMSPRSLLLKNGKIKAKVF